MAFAAYHFADVCMSVRDDDDEVVTINTNLLIAVFQLIVGRYRKNFGSAL